MKKLLSLIIFIFIGLSAWSQTINVSTGINASGLPLPNNTTDPFWNITDLGPSTAKVTPSHPFWEPTPVAVTNAKWINDSGTPFQGSTPGIHTIERNFNVSGTASTITCNFGVAYDDAFVSLEIIDPASSSTVLTVVPTTAYHLSLPITTVIPVTSPGTWKIKATINFIDQIGGFLLSGTVMMDTCASIPVYTSGLGCGTAACPYVATGIPGGGTFSAPLNPVTGVYIGPIPMAGIPYTYTYTVGTCVYTASGVISKLPPPAPAIIPYFGPSAAGAQLVVMWQCIPFSCTDYYEFRITQLGLPVPGCTLTYSSIAPGATSLPWMYTPLPSGMCAKILTCPGLVLGQNYEVRMRVNRCGIAGAWGPPTSVLALKPANNNFNTSTGVEKSLMIHPNPAQDLLKIDMQANQSSEVQIILMDMSGRIVKRMNTVAVEGLNQMSLSLDNLNNGMYFIQVLENNQIIHKEKVSVVK